MAEPVESSQLPTGADAPGDEHWENDVEPAAPVPPPPPPAAPRPMTPHVRRRLWAEPRVRIWWIGTLVLAAIAVNFVVKGYRSRAHESWLIQKGTRVDATILVAGEERLAGRKETPDSAVQIRFTWDGKDFEPYYATLPGRKEFIVTGSILPIHVNPQNPQDWTWLDEPLPLLTQIIGGVITLPLIVLAGAWAVARYLKTARAWREGVSEVAIVLGTHIAAIAPWARALHVTTENLADRRVYLVFVPPAIKQIQPGEAIHIIRAAPNSKWALAASWME